LIEMALLNACQAFNQLNPYGNLSAAKPSKSLAKIALKSGVSYGLNGVVQTNLSQMLIQQLFDAMPKSWFKSKKEKEIIETIVTVIVDLVLIAVGAKLLMNGTSSSTKVMNGMSKLLKTDKLTLATRMSQAQFAGNIAESGINGGSGIVEIQMGEITKMIGESNASIELMGGLLRVIEGLGNAEMKNIESALKNISTAQIAVDRAISETYGAAAQFEARA